MRFLHFSAFRRYSRSGCTCGFCSSPLYAGTSARVVHAVSAFLRFSQVLALGVYVRFLHFYAFRRYFRSGCTCGFCISPLFACTRSPFVHAVSAYFHFTQVLALEVYMWFLHISSFRMYSLSIYTCNLCSFPLSAGTSAQIVHVLSAYLLFLHVLALHSYMWFLHLSTLRRYFRSSCTCGFCIFPLFAGTRARGVRAVSAFFRFPQVLPLELYMRLLLLPALRRYFRPGCTCGFCSFSLFAGTHARVVHAVSAFFRFSQVLALGVYMRFLHFSALRRYFRSDCTCGLWLFSFKKVAFYHFYILLMVFLLFLVLSEYSQKKNATALTSIMKSYRITS